MESSGAAAESDLIHVPRDGTHHKYMSAQQSNSLAHKHIDIIVMSASLGAVLQWSAVAIVTTHKHHPPSQ